MAANEFATMLHKNCHKIVVILVYAVLEWILILLLLLNSLFSYLIAKFAKFFGLKQSCTWCARLDHVFNTTKKSHFDHVCEAHGTEISKMGYCSSHSKLADSKNMCIHCSSSQPTVAFFTLITETASEDRCSCCDQILTRKVHAQPLMFKPCWDLLFEYIHKNKVGFEEDLLKTKTEFQENGCKQVDGDQSREKAEVGEECVRESSEEWSSSQTTTDDPFWNLGCHEDDESAADMLLQNAELMDSDQFICIELIDADSTSKQMPLVSSSEDVEQEEAGLQETDQFSNTEGDGEATIEIEGVVESLKTTIEAQEKALNALHAELEEERRAAAEAAQETMAMITKLQEEKAAMQMEALQYQRMMEEQAEYDQEALQLLNDLMLKREKEKKELEKELQIYRANALLEHKEATETSRRMGSLVRTTSNTSSNNSIHLDYDHQHHNLDEETGVECITNSIIPDISLAEFDEERLSILEELKALESKLFNLHHEDGDDIKAEKLLPLFDAAENDEEEISNQSEAMINNNLYEGKGKILMHEELGHVYERLQALEADKDFLKYCIRSMMKGNQGMGLLQEILQHLRDLKSVELSATATNMVEVPLRYASMDRHDCEE